MTTKEQVDEIVKPLLAIVECFNPKRDYLYLSTPITTGKLFYDTLRKYNIKDKKDFPKDVYYEEVILANIFDAQKVSNNLKKIGLEKIVNPAKFDEMKNVLKINPNWHQEVYMKLWEGVINRFVKQIIFNDGWEYSSGCVEEWTISQNKNRNCGIEDSIDLRGNIITQKDFENKVSNAIKILEEEGFNTDKLKYSLENSKKIYYT